MAGLAASRACRRKGSRPKSLNAKDIVMAKGMLTDPDITMDDVAKRLGVSTATLSSAGQPWSDPRGCRLTVPLGLS